VSNLVFEILLRLLKPTAAVVLGALLYGVLTGALGAAGSAELALLSFLSATAFVLLVQDLAGRLEQTLHPAVLMPAEGPADVELDVRGERDPFPLGADRLRSGGRRLRGGHGWEDVADGRLRDASRGRWSDRCTLPGVYANRAWRGFVGPLRPRGGGRSGPVRRILSLRGDACTVVVWSWRWCSYWPR